VSLVFRSYSQVISGFFNIHEFGPPLHVTAASTCSRVDHLRFGSIASDLVALLALGFPSPPLQNSLGWPLTITRRLIMQKASSHRALRPRLLHIVGIWLQELFHSPNRGSFHLSLAVLVHYRLPR